MSSELARPYRGRLAPSPTGYLHVGHARTFWLAAERARAAGGTLILRNEDLDKGRCRPEYVAGMLEDLRWLGLTWSEGPDVGGAFAPYDQSARWPWHREVFHKLRDKGLVYPCLCSRRDIQAAASAPHAGDEEPIYPGTCRHRALEKDAGAVAWRFRVPDGESIRFHDGLQGEQTFVAGRDFGDFVVWRREDLPSYQLAVVADDFAMRITEVVRGADLLVSTARQILLYRALDWPVPAFAHGALVTDAGGVRLAKRHDALSVRALRARGFTPEQIRAGGGAEPLFRSS